LSGLESRISRPATSIVVYFDFAITDIFAITTAGSGSTHRR
jgi:hypothetical protein